MLDQQRKFLRTEIGLLAIVALAFATRLYRLDGQSLWFDEIFTVAVAQLPWYDGLLGLLGHGIQLTPLFHWAIKLWLNIGASDWLLRVPAAMVGVLTIPLVFKLGQFYYNDQVGLVAAFIFAINPYQVWYGQELRLYTLLGLAAAGAMLAFGQMLATEGRQGGWKLFFFNLIGFPTHYFMFLISTVQFLYLLTTFRRTHALLWRWTAAQALAVIPLVFWWGFIIQQNRSNVGIGWIPHPQPLSPLFTLWNFSFGYTSPPSVATLFFVGLMLLGLGLGLRRAWHKPGRGWLLTLWLVLPLTVTFSLSFGRISFYMDRYLIIIAPVLTILTVSGLLGLSLRPLRWTLLLAFVTATGWGLFNVYFDRSNFAKTDWRALARTLEAQAQAGTAVITCTDGYRLAYEYYNPHQVTVSEEVLDINQLSTVTASPNHQTAWIVVTHPLPSVHALANIEPPILDKTLLSPAAVAWESHNFEGNITVAGISAYHYNLADSSLLPEVVAWYCQQSVGVRGRRPQ